MRSGTLMSKGERDDLHRHIRQREKVLKSAAKQRSAELLAGFEHDLAAKFSFDDDKTWAEAISIAKQELAKANATIAARSRELGIPASFAPSYDGYWHSRGENAAKERRAELRKVALAQIAASQQKAFTKIEMHCLQAQEQIIIAGLTSAAARRFLEQLPSVETLMPHLSFAEVTKALPSPRQDDDDAIEEPTPSKRTRQRVPLNDDTGRQ